jgi:phytanoyl-CoA hydroxylase
MDMQHPAGPVVTADDITRYRREGWMLLRGVLGPRHVAACLDALSGLASGRIPARQTTLMWENGPPPADTPAEARELLIRKYMDFCEDAPALRDAAMSAALHRALDRVLGEGRVLFQEMALVKPPLIGGEKPWHQDCSYFRVTDPGLVVGVWIALDEAKRENGCMELIAGSHLWGPMPHHHENDFNRCRIREDLLQPEQRVAIEMQPGDALVFHGLLQHYTAPNRSPLRRRAIQFHYHQVGAVWGSLEDHRRLFHDEAGNYAGCTVPHAHLPGGNYAYRDGLPRPVVPVETAD